MIKQFIHGNKETDMELFCLIGEWAVSEVVHKALGTEITSRPSDIWLISTGTNKQDGFAQIRIMTNKKAHIRYLFANNKAVQSSLINAALKMVKKEGLESIFTNDREAADIWGKEGFTKGEKPPRGSFCRWEKELNT